MNIAIIGSGHIGASNAFDVSSPLMADGGGAALPAAYDAGALGTVVSVDLEGRRQLLALGFDTTPVTIIGERVIEGFDGDAIDSALAELRH